MKKEDKQIELRSEKVRNIIGQIPAVMVRWGTAMIGLALAAMVVAAAIIPYRPSVDTAITVTQDVRGGLHYTAGIPQKERAKLPEFSGVSIRSSPYGTILPECFTIIAVSDTAELSGRGSVYRITLQPQGNVAPKVELKTDLILQGKIEMNKTTLLKWVIGKILPAAS